MFKPHAPIVKARRREFIKTSLASAAVALGAPGISRAAKPYDGQTLSVFTYAGSYESTMKSHLIKQFEERTGARVRLEAGWWDMLPKLKASPKGSPVYDVVMTDPTQGYPAIKEGLLRQYDPANVPNARKTARALREDWVQAKNWGANVASSLMVMGFHKDMVANPPQHWHELRRDDLRGKLSLYNAPYMSLYTFAMMKAGAEGRPGKGREELIKDLDGVLKYAKDNRDLVRVWWQSTGDFMSKLFAKEISGGVVHSSGPFPAEDGGQPVRSIVPSEGTAMAQVFWSVTSGTTRQRLAEEWMNDFFSEAFQIKWGTVAKLGVPNVEAAKVAAAESPFYKRFLPATEADWDKITLYPYDIYFEGNNWTKITDFWDREVLRKG